MPKQTDRLSHQQVKKPYSKIDKPDVSDGNPKDLYDGEARGLHLRVFPTGRKSWRVRYKIDGRRRRMKIGDYPAMKLSQARKKARGIRQRALQGEDPLAERRQKRAPDNSFRGLVDYVLDLKSETTRESTQHERRRIADKDLLPRWGDRPASEITRWDISQALSDIMDRGSPAVANRTLRVIKLIFNTGLKKGFPTLEANPAHMMEAPAKTEGRDRYLTREDLKAVWRATEPERPITRGIFRLTFLTAQRVGAVRAMRRDHIDDANVWRIPADTFKSGRPHLVPLSAEALEILESLLVVKDQERWVFPGRVDGAEPHVSSTNSALRRVRARTDEMGVEHWILHDARRTFRTHATRPREPGHPSDPVGLGVDPPVADAVLGHKEASLGRARYTGDAERYRLGQKRRALEAWGEFVAEAVEGYLDD